MSVPDSGIDLVDAVAAVRDQLIEAAVRGAGERIGFEVGPIQLEFTVELRRDVTAKAEIRAWVFTADASIGASSNTVHKASLTLTPKDLKTGEVILVGNESKGSTELFGSAR